MDASVEAGQRASGGRRWLALTSIDAPAAGFGSVGQALPHGALATRSHAFSRATRNCELIDEARSALQELLPAQALNGEARTSRGASLGRAQRRAAAEPAEWVSRPFAPNLHPNSDLLKPRAPAYSIPPEVESRHRSFDPVPFFAPPAGAYDPTYALIHPRAPATKFGPPPAREPKTPGRPARDGAASGGAAGAPPPVCEAGVVPSCELGGSASCSAEFSQPSAAFASVQPRWPSRGVDERAPLLVSQTAVRPQPRACSFGTEARRCVPEASWGGRGAQGGGGEWAGVWWGDEEWVGEGRGGEGGAVPWPPASCGGVGEGEGAGGDGENGTREGCGEGCGAGGAPVGEEADDVDVGHEPSAEAGAAPYTGGGDDGAHTVGGPVDALFAPVERRAPAAGWSLSTSSRGLLPAHTRTTPQGGTGRAGQVPAGQGTAEAVTANVSVVGSPIQPTQSRLEEAGRAAGSPRVEDVRRARAAESARPAFGSSAPRMAWLADATPR
jgi:hypothetical protein